MFYKYDFLALDLYDGIVKFNLIKPREKMKKHIPIILLLLSIVATPLMSSEPKQACLNEGDVEKFIVVFPIYINWLDLEQKVLDSTTTTENLVVNANEFREFCENELESIGWNLDQLVLKTSCILDAYYQLTLNRLLDEFDTIYRKRNKNVNDDEVDDDEAEQLSELGQILSSVSDKTDERVLVNGVKGLLKINPHDLKRVQRNYSALRVMFKQIDQGKFLAQHLIVSDENF